MRALSITAIVTAYERVEFLTAALESIQAQHRRPDEIIVADDSASRDIERICAGFTNIRVSYTPRRPTMGVALNLRRAWEQATGDLVAILNDDDTWEPDFLAVAAAVLEREPEVELFFSDHWLVDRNGRRLESQTDKNTVSYGRAALDQGVVRDLGTLVWRYNGVPMAMAAVVRRKSVVPEWLCPEVGGAYDLWISSQLAAAGARAWYCPRRLTQYRLHERMATASRQDFKYDAHVYIFGALLTDKRLNKWRSDLRERLALVLRKAAQVRYLHRRFGEARTLASRSLQTRFTVEALVVWIVATLRIPPTLVARIARV